MLNEADMGITSMAMGDREGDQNLLVKFYKHPHPNDQLSKEMGRPVFEDVDYIQIMQPGNKDSIIVRKAREKDKQRFPDHYRRYLARVDDDQIEGTLLSETPLVTRAQCEELSFLNIKTVEQLANVSDSNAQNIMGIQKLKQKAQVYLEQSEANAAAQQLAEQKAENARLLELIGQLNDRLDELEKPKPRRRTKKAAAAEQQE